MINLKPLIRFYILVARNRNCQFTLNNFAWEREIIKHKNEFIRTAGQPQETRVCTAEDEDAQAQEVA